MAEQCEMIIGYLVPHRCENPSLGTCVKCGRGYCDEHTNQTREGRLCLACQSQRSGRHREPLTFNVLRALQPRVSFQKVLKEFLREVKRLDSNTTANAHVLVSCRGFDCERVRGRPGTCQRLCRLARDIRVRGVVRMHRDVVKGQVTS